MKPSDCSPHSVILQPCGDRSIKPLFPIDSRMNIQSRLAVAEANTWSDQLSLDQSALGINIKPTFTPQHLIVTSRIIITVFNSFL